MVDIYSLGFAFDAKSNIALIRKAGPAWQLGHLNGIGGHVELGESPEEGMVREFHEEAGLYVRDWTHFVTMRSRDTWDVFVFVAKGVDLSRVRTCTIEEVVVVPAHHLPAIVIPNLRWLVPMALDFGYSMGDHARVDPTDVWFEKGA